MFKSKQLAEIEYVDANSLSTYHDVFRAVLAAYGGSPSDDVIDALFDCARRLSTLSRRRRRRRTSRSVRSCRCQRRATRNPWRSPRTSPGDGRTPHLEDVRHEHTHLHRRRSIMSDDDKLGKIWKLSLNYTQRRNDR